jgi:peroxiredoxin
MANSETTTNPNDLGHWVDDRLDALTPDPDWQPMASAHLPSVAPRQAADRRRRLRWTGAAIAVATVLWFVPITRAIAARCLEACVSATTSVTQLWRADEPEASAPRVVGLSIGDIAPDFAGLDRTGQPVRLSSLRGRMVVLNFWATWCGPCKVEIPMLNDLQTRFGASGAAVIGVSIDDTGWQAISEFVTEQDIRYTVTLADDATTQAFGGIGEVPMTLLIDRDGRIIVKRIGVLTEGGDREQIARLLER